MKKAQVTRENSKTSQLTYTLQNVICLPPRATKNKIKQVLAMTQIRYKILQSLCFLYTYQVSGLAVADFLFIYSASTQSDHPLHPRFTHTHTVMQTNPHECKHKATKSLNTLSFGIYTTTNPVPSHLVIQRTCSWSCSGSWSDFFCCWPAAPVLCPVPFSSAWDSSAWGLFMFICWHNLVTLFAYNLLIVCRARCFSWNQVYID